MLANTLREKLRIALDGSSTEQTAPQVLRASSSRRSQKTLQKGQTKDNPDVALGVSLNSGVVEDVRDGRVLRRRPPRGGVVVVVNVIGGLSDAGTGQRHGLVVPQAAAAAARTQDGCESASELVVEEGVQERVDARIGSTEPLRQRRRHRQRLPFPRGQSAAQLYAGEDGVQGQPRRHE